MLSCLWAMSKILLRDLTLTATNRHQLKPNVTTRSDVPLGGVMELETNPPVRSKLKNQLAAKRKRCFSIWKPPLPRRSSASALDLGDTPCDKTATIWNQLRKQTSCFVTCWNPLFCDMNKKKHTTESFLRYLGTGFSWRKPAFKWTRPGDPSPASDSCGMRFLPSVWITCNFFEDMFWNVLGRFMKTILDMLGNKIIKNQQGGVHVTVPNGWPGHEWFEHSDSYTSSLITKSKLRQDFQ